MANERDQAPSNPPTEPGRYTFLASDLRAVRADLQRVADQEQDTPAGRALRVLSDIADVAADVLADPSVSTATQRTADAVRANPALAVALNALFVSSADDESLVAEESAGAAGAAGAAGEGVVDVAPVAESVVAAEDDSVRYMKAAEFEELSDPFADDLRPVGFAADSDNEPESRWAEPWPEIHNIESRLDPQWLDRLDYAPAQRNYDDLPKHANVIDIREQDDDGFGDLAAEQQQAAADAEHLGHGIDVWQELVDQEDAQVHELGSAPAADSVVDITDSVVAQEQLDVVEGDDSWLVPGTEVISLPPQNVTVSRADAGDDDDEDDSGAWFVRPANPTKPLSW